MSRFCTESNKDWIYLEVKRLFLVYLVYQQAEKVALNRRIQYKLLINW